MDMDEDELSQLEQRKRRNSSDENASYNSIEFENEYEPADDYDTRRAGIQQQIGERS